MRWTNTLRRLILAPIEESLNARVQNLIYPEKQNSSFVDHMISLGGYSEKILKTLFQKSGEPGKHFQQTDC